MHNNKLVSRTRQIYLAIVLLGVLLVALKVLLAVLSRQIWTIYCRKRSLIFQTVINKSR